MDTGGYQQKGEGAANWHSSHLSKLSLVSVCVYLCSALGWGWGILCDEETNRCLSGGSQDPVGAQEVKVQNWEEIDQDTGPVSLHIPDELLCLKHLA